MYDIVTKVEAFSWLDSGYANPHRHAMKNIQDAFILSRLDELREKKILEVGGGHSRILERLAASNECWNADKMEGAGAGPTEEKDQGKILLKKVFLGDFSQEIPEGYFDVVFSISVLEHVPSENLESLFADAWRVLKPGGSSIHAIDVYLGDADNIRVNKRIDEYRIAAEKVGFIFEVEPILDQNTVFKSHYSSNSDLELHNWNSLVPGAMKKIRVKFQNVSMKFVVDKPNGS